MVEISDLTIVEQRVWRAFPDGAAVDLRESEDEDAAGREVRGPDRAVRGEVLRALLLRGASAEGASEGLWLAGARIVGRLDLAYGTLTAPVRLLGCSFEQAPDLYGAHTRQLDFSRSCLPGLHASDVRSDGALRLTGCHLTGPVVLTGAQVTSSLFLDRTRTTGPIHLDGARIDGALVVEAAQLDGGEEVSMSAVNASVGGGVVGKDLTARGTVLLTGLRVGGTLNLEGSHLVHPGAEALAAAVMTVDLDVLCNGLRAKGEVRFTRSRIGGRLNLERARIANPGHAALRLGGVAVAPR